MNADSSSQVVSPTPLPRKFARYTLFDFVGRGGMAEIYLGRSTTELGAARLSIVKLILPEYAALPKFAEMLTFEAKLAAQLSHANVVQVFDLGRENDQLFIAMEYVEGFDLNALLRRCSKQKIPLPIEFGIYVVISALRGLDYAHRRTDETGQPLGIVHRDVSPSNLLISFEGEVKLCDFGIAHANDAMSNLAASAVDAAAYRQPEENLSEALQGKAGYMSPEHARGEVLDARADVFAAGIVLWELLAGRRMYKVGDGSNGTSLLEIARNAVIPALPARGLPQEEKLSAVVRKALAKDKSERYASAAAMLRDLEGYAIETRTMASPLKLGEWMAEHFGVEVIERRRARERGAAAIAKGPLLVMTPIASPKIEEAQPALKDVSSNALLNVPSSDDLAKSAARDPSPTPSDTLAAEIDDIPPTALIARFPEESEKAKRQMLVRVITLVVVGAIVSALMLFGMAHQMARPG